MRRRPRVIDARFPTLRQVAARSGPGPVRGGPAKRPAAKRIGLKMPEVMFAGPDGRLEGRYHHSKRPNAPVALILHPHPLHGGTMNNRVTYSLYQRFQAMGFSVLR